jgi:hypothetical protein
MTCIATVQQVLTKIRDGGRYMGSSQSLQRQNRTVAKATWPERINRAALQQLDRLARQLRLSAAAGDLLLIGRAWYVTHTGLLRLAQRRHCSGIHVQPATEFCDPAAARWAFKATVYKSPKCKGFVGYGDANPSNVSSVVRGAEMRVAETRAVNRALRKAYGIGICSVEELGSFSGPLTPAAQVKKPAVQTEPANGNGHPLRDRLRLLIRQHQLDPALVKLYAADFCGTQELRQASRELVEDFIQHLTQYAAHDRDGLLCELNSFAPRPVTPSTDTSGDGPKAEGVA